MFNQQSSRINQHVLSAAFAAVSLLMAGAASATAFDGGIPAGWVCVGGCGTLGANGVVTTSPEGGDYGWVSTSGGPGGNTGGFGGTNGSTLTSTAFSATAGDNLQFFFNFVTSDGAGYADYAWSRLLDSSNNAVSLFTARTTPSGNSVPGFGMPTIDATISPATVTIIPGGPVWAPLAGNSGTCFNTGCGYSGWVQADYAILNTGLYTLDFGVANWSDTIWETGLAFDGVTVAGIPIDDGNKVPEPSSLALIGIALAGFGALRRRKA
jgi:hypothetical protein